MTAAVVATAADYLATAALAACFVPAGLFLHGSVALATALCMVTVIGAVVAWLRPEKGLLAVIQTFAVLAIAAVLCTAVAFI